MRRKDAGPAYNQIDKVERGEGAEKVLQDRQHAKDGYRRSRGNRFFAADERS